MKLFASDSEANGVCTCGERANRRLHNIAFCEKRIMKTATSKVLLRGEACWPAPNSNQQEEVRSGFPRDNFDGAPYPFAIILGATTTLLLVTTIRSLWFLFSA